MSDVLTEPNNLGDVLLYEAEDYFYSRDEITLSQGERIRIGEVLARNNESGEYVALNPEGGEIPGTDIASAIAIRRINASDEAVETVALVRHCIVKQAGLVWPEDITDEAQTRAIAQLRAQGILIRR